MGRQKTVRVAMTQAQAHTLASELSLAECSDSLAVRRMAHNVKRQIAKQVKPRSVAQAEEFAVLVGALR